MLKDIPGFEELYAIDEDGNVFGKKANRYLKTYFSNKGYKMIDLHKNNKKYKLSIHRLVAITFIENPNNYPIVLHLDNIKTNTNVSNLKWGTYSENNAQAIRDGLNKVPSPDNRKIYNLYNGNYDERVICLGAKEVLEKIKYGSESVIRNLVFRHDKVKEGPYKGYEVRRVINPFKFIE